MNRDQIVNNPYYYWWRFLQLAPQPWEPHVERDFGPADDAETFEQWWEQCQDLFDCVELMRERGEIADEAMIEVLPSADRWDAEVADGDVVIRLTLGWPKKDLIAAFERLLQKVQPGGRGRPKHGTTDAEYPLYTTPDTPSLHVCLQIYTEAKTSNDTVTAIGERLGYDQPTTLRYHMWANDLIENVAKGVFPKHR